MVMRSLMYWLVLGGQKNGITKVKRMGYIYMKSQLNIMDLGYHLRLPLIATCCFRLISTKLI